MVSNRTIASLLSDLGFMHRTAKPRRDSSVQASALMKFDVRCMTSTPTWGDGRGASGMYRAPLTEAGTPWNRTYRGILCADAGPAMHMMLTHATTARRLNVIANSLRPRPCRAERMVARSIGVLLQRRGKHDRHFGRS